MAGILSPADLNNQAKQGGGVSIPPSPGTLLDINNNTEGEETLQEGKQLLNRQGTITITTGEDNLEPNNAKQVHSLAKSTM